MLQSKHKTYIQIPCQKIWNEISHILERHEPHQQTRLCRK